MGEVECGLQSSVPNRFLSAAGSDAMSPRAQKLGVHVRGWQVPMGATGVPHAASSLVADPSGARSTPAGPADECFESGVQDDQRASPTAPSADRDLLNPRASERPLIAPLSVRMTL